MWRLTEFFTIMVVAELCLISFKLHVSGSDYRGLHKIQWHQTRQLILGADLLSRFTLFSLPPNT